MSTPSAPQSVTFLTSPATVTYADGSPFNGFVWLGLDLPVGYTKAALWNSQKHQSLPLYVEVCITGGIIDNTTQAFCNPSIEPQNTQYVAYYFDKLKTLIAPASGTATPFTIPNQIGSYTLTVPTLANRTPGITPPVPET